MLVAAKFGDPVLGVDIHMVLIPAPPAPPIPAPLPHPFIGVVFDPIGLAVGCLMSAVFGGGGPVLINSMPCGNTGTEVKGVPHFPTPPGISFAPNDIPGNEGVLFMGSQTVNMGGDSIARLTDMVISCNFPINLPTSVCLAVPMGPPVLVGGPPAINFLAAATQMIRTKWVSDQLHSLLKAKPGSRLSKVICFFTGHPVDVMTGEVVTAQTDFELPGPMPLVFERNYYSRSAHDGPLGPGWHHPLDASVTDEGWRLTLRLEDGRERWHAPMPVGASHWDPIERYTLARTAWGYTLALPDGRTLSFARVEGREGFALVRIEDRCGNALRLAYASGHLAEVIDSANRKVTFHHRGDGRLSSVVLHRANGAQRTLARYDYAPSGHLASAADALGAAWRYEYRGGVLTRETDRGGMSFYFEYDWEHPEGWCVRTWGDGGLYDHRLTYDKNAHVTVVEDSRGGRRQYFGDSRGVVVKRVDETGGAWVTAYDEHLRRTAEEDPLGHRWAWTYDARGNQIVERNPLGHERRATFNDAYRPLTLTDRQGGQWRREYDRFGLVVREVDPAGGERRMAYDARGKLVQRVDGQGRVEQRRFREDGGLLEEIDPTGAVTRFELDDLGRPVRRLAPDGDAIEVTWDECDRVTALLRNGRPLAQRSYDARGNPLRFIDREGRETRYRYAGIGKLREVDGPDGVVRFTYDTEENLVAVEKASGERWRFHHDLARRLVRQETFDGRSLAFRYDRAGWCVETVDHRGRRTVIERDPEGRMTRVRAADKRETRIEYTAEGMLSLAANPDCELRFERDALGRVLQEACDGVTVESRYDAAGRRVARSTSLGHRALYDFAPDGRVAAMSLGLDPRWMQWDAQALATAPGMERPWTVRVQRDAMGRETGRSLPGGVEATWSYDDRGQPVRRAVHRGDDELLARSLHWDEGGRLAMQIDPARGPTRYAHALNDAVVAAHFPDGTTQHRARDLDGNVFRTADRSDRVYDPGGALREAFGTRYVRDTEGRVVEKVRPDGSRWRYAWSADGQLRAVRGPDDREVTFAYDPLGRRVRKSINGQTTRFVWDGDAVVHEVRDDASCVTWLTEPHTHAPVARVEGDARWSVVTDHLGTPEALLDEAGQIAWQAQLDLYGVARTDVAQVPCPWRWPGQYEDPETGLYYNRFRYYDPEAGQYISPDPLELDGGPTLYAYVDDPLAYFDYFGLIDGGSYYGVRSSSVGGEVNHVPAWSSFKNLTSAPNAPAGHGSASAVWMDTVDHRQTASCGSSASASTWRATQAAHISAGDWHHAIEMDVLDIQGIAGNKYDNGLREMLDHHVAAGRITTTQRDQIKTNCGL